MKKNSIILALLIFAQSCSVSFAMQPKSNADNSSSTIFTTFLVAGVGVLSGILAYHLFHETAEEKPQKKKIEIRNYDHKNDSEQVIELFNKNSKQLGTTWDRSK